MILTEITTLDLPALEPYRTLRGRTHHWKDGFFVTEGEKAVRALLSSEVRVASLLLNRDWLDTLQDLLATERCANVPVYLAADELLEGIVGFPLHQKLLAIGMIPENVPLAQLQSPAPGRHVHVALEGLADAENMGMILRNCAAFGVESLLVGPDSTSPWLRRSVRVSLGNVFCVPVHRSRCIRETLQRCREEYGWKLVATTPRDGVASLPRDGRGSEHICLVFGSEAEGLSEELLDLCDLRYCIPMRRGVDSINIANAVAVSLYEATRHDG